MRKRIFTPSFVTRPVHHDCNLLVRRKHHQGIFWPLLSWNKVRKWPCYCLRDPKMKTSWSFVTEVVCRRYEIGEGLYIGWSSSVLALAGGACLCCSCKVGGAEKEWVSFGNKVLVLYFYPRIEESLIKRNKSWNMIIYQYKSDWPRKQHIIFETSKVFATHWSREQRTDIIHSKTVCFQSFGRISFSINLHKRNI